MRSYQRAKLRNEHKTQLNICLPKRVFIHNEEAYRVSYSGFFEKLFDLSKLPHEFSGRNS